MRNKLIPGQRRCTLLASPPSDFRRLKKNIDTKRLETKRLHNQRCTIKYLSSRNFCKESAEWCWALGRFVGLGLPISWPKVVGVTNAVCTQHKVSEFLIDPVCCFDKRVPVDSEFSRWNAVDFCQIDPGEAVLARPEGDQKRLPLISGEPIFKTLRLICFAS